MSSLDNTPSYICFGEHFLNSSSVQSFNFDDYNLASYNVRTNKKRGGTLILAKENTSFEETSIGKKLYKQDCFEVCTVKDKDTGLHICCLYKVPQDGIFNNFINNLECMLDYYFDKKCVILGDFNIDVTKTTNKYTVELLNLLSSYNFRPIIDCTTFIRGDHSSCIDNIITNLDNDCIVNTKVDHNNLADGHGALLCSVEMYGKSKDVPKKEVRKLRSLSKKNNILFRNYISKENWMSKGINNFIKTLHGIFNNSFPLKNIMIDKSKEVKSTWITKGVKTSSKMKRFLNSINKSCCDGSILTYRRNYLRIFKRVINLAKKSSLQRQLDKATNKSKKIWEVINKQTNGKRKLKTDNHIKLINGDHLVKEPEHIANLFCESFNLKPLKNDYNNIRAMKMLHENQRHSFEEMSSILVTPHMVNRIVKNMPSKKSAGYDEMPLGVIKDNIDLLSEPLAYLFNSCLQSSIFPEQLSIATITPIHKKGDKTNSQNYRPISVLPTVSKIFEKCVTEKLVEHLNKTKALSKRQFGYRKGVNTSIAMETLVEDVICKLNNKNKVLAVFLDLSSAFDTVEHELILKKLEFYGIRGELLNFFKSYLTNRYQFVEIKSVVNRRLGQIYDNVSNPNTLSKVRVTSRSKMVKVKSGVPQGSVLGPILFVLMVNDVVSYINNKVTNTDIVLFADDTNAVICDKSLNELEKKANLLVNGFKYWFDSNNLTLNSKKTSAILFKTTARDNDEINLYINNDKIDLTNKVKFLGVVIDENLNWKSELEEIENKISSACYALRSLRNQVDKKHLLMVYYALVESRLRYSIKLWGNSYKYNMTKAFIIQKRAIRMLVRIPPWESCRPHFKDLKILTAPSLYILLILCDFVKRGDFSTYKENVRTLNGIIPPPFHPRLQIAEHSTSYQEVKLFNKLPKDLKHIRHNFMMFRRRLKEFLLTNCYYSLEEYLC